MQKMDAQSQQTIESFIQTPAWRKESLSASFSANALTMRTGKDLLKSQASSTTRENAQNLTPKFF